MMVSRCASPAPSPAGALSVAEEKESYAMHDEEQTTLPLSSLILLFAMLVPVGYAALHTDSEELLDDPRTSTALAVFLLFGFLMWRFDFVDAIEEEAEKEDSHSMPEISLLPAWCWLILGCGVAVILALTGSIRYEHDFVTEQASSYAANLKHAMLRDTPTWTALGLFVMLGAAVMRCDFADALEEERRKHGIEASNEQSPSSAGRWLLFFGSAVALSVSLAVVWAEESSQCGLGGSLFMEVLQSYASDVKDAFSFTVAMLLLGDTPTWTALAIFFMFGAVIIRFDFVNALKEESQKEGLDVIGDYALIPKRLWLVLGSGVALALAGYHRWQISGHMAQEVSIFFLSAVLAIGLALTISNSPKSTIARAFTPPMKSR